MGEDAKEDPALSMEAKAKLQASIKDKEKKLCTGFVAKDVEQAAMQMGYEFSGVDKPADGNGLYGLRYSEFVVQSLSIRV